MSPEVLITLGDPPRTERLTRSQAEALANGLLQQRQGAAAATVATQLAGQAPDDAAAQLLAARALYELGELMPARTFLERSFALGNDAADALHLKSRICMELGDAAASLAAIEAILKRQPRSSFYHCVYGQQRLKAGDLAGARESLQTALAINPREIAAFATLSRLPGDPAPDQCRFVEFLLSSGQLTPDDEIRAHYALALQYERLGEDARQFAHLAAMNTKKRRQVSFDAARSRADTLRMIDHYPAELLRQLPPAAGAAARLIFVYGFPRSGTTLAEQVLAAHPGVVAAGETSAFMQSLMAVAGHDCGVDATAAFVDLREPRVRERIRQGYLARVPQLAAGRWVTDKSPENFMLAGLIPAIFPEAKLVHVRRHPVATCYSCYKQVFFGAAIPYSYSMADLVSRYGDYRLISRHWEAALPGRINTLEYEQLVGAPEETARALLAACGLPWDDACLTPAANRGAVNTASSVQVRQGIGTGSVDRWRRYAPYLQPLLALEADR
jgi:tetratricopeptide (TPR) repeat protein